MALGSQGTDFTVLKECASQMHINVAEQTIQSPIAPLHSGGLSELSKFSCALVHTGVITTLQPFLTSFGDFNFLTTLIYIIDSYAIHTSDTNFKNALKIKVWDGKQLT